ncbi:DUF6247 family protein [Streptomyces sp. NPDC002536]
MDDIAADAPGPSPLIPQPASNPEALRAALTLLAPQLLPAFEAEWATALKRARETVSAGPLHQFIGPWAMHVAIQRHPDRAARLGELETRAAETDSLDEARAMISEIGRILDFAAVEAGIAQYPRPR